MTREEAKKIILKHQFAFASMPYEVIKAVSYLIEEQEPILDKIRTEILDNAFSVVNPRDTYEYINVIDLDSIDEILDKYKAETENA